MLGGVIAITVGLFFAGIAWDSMWPWGAFVAWIAPQQLLTQWVVGCLLVGGVLLVGGARAAGAALVGSLVGSIVSWLLRVVGLYGGDHLETLVHVTSFCRASAWSCSASAGSEREPAPRWVDTRWRWPWRSPRWSSGR
jgi:hypothetical protein